MHVVDNAGACVLLALFPPPRSGSSGARRYSILGLAIMKDESAPRAT